MTEKKTTEEILYQGDCLEVMKTLKTQSVDCVITDPLYNCDLNVQELQRVCRGNIIVFVRLKINSLSLMNLCSG